MHSGSNKCGQKCCCSGNDFYLGIVDYCCLYQKICRVGYSRSSCVRYIYYFFIDRTVGDFFCRLFWAVTVKTEERLFDAQMFHEYSAPTSIFTDNKVGVGEHLYCSKCYIFKIAYWSCDKREHLWGDSGNNFSNHFFVSYWFEENTSNSILYISW